jgi:hypothetical protein
VPFVLKKGSKMCGRMAAPMPCPWSATEMRTQEPPHRAVLAEVAVLEVHRAAEPLLARHLVERGLLVLGDHEVDEGPRAKLLRAVAEHLREGRVRPEEGAVRVGDAHEVRGRLKEAEEDPSSPTRNRGVSRTQPSSVTR